MLILELGLCFSLFIWPGLAQREQLDALDVPPDWRNALDESVLNMTSLNEMPLDNAPDNNALPFAADFSAKETKLPNETNENETELPPENTGILLPKHIWPKTGNRTIIPCFISLEFDWNQKSTIKVALERIESQTGNCITFPALDAETVKTRSPRDYIRFVKNDKQTCFTFIGKREEKDKNDISLSRYCLEGLEAHGIVMHEILHKLGFIHEHSRPDRGDFVRIHSQHMDKAQTRNSQFDRLPNMETYGFDYDVESIMHYAAFDTAPKAFAGAGSREPTITPRFGKVRMGQRANLTDGDIRKILHVYQCCPRERLEDCVRDIRTAKPATSTSVPPGPDFSLWEMNATEWKRQEINQKCRFPVDLAETLRASMPMAMAISCNINVTKRDVTSLVKGISRGVARPVGIFLHDNRAYMTKEIFHSLAKYVVIFVLRECRDYRATALVRTLGFVNLLRFHLSNCADLEIKKEDFLLDHLRMISFSNTTILSLEDGTFDSLPSLVSVSLEHSANLMSGMTEKYAEYLFLLHCSCGFSAFRRWLHSEHMAKVHSRNWGEIYNITNSWINSPVSSRTLHLNYDCTKRAIEPAGNDENLSRFSLNDSPCIMRAGGSP